MLDKIKQVVTRYDEIERQMTDPAVLADHVKLTELAQERSDLQALVEAYREHERVAQELADARELAELETGEMAELAEAEIETLEAHLESLDSEMRRLLVPKDPRDERNVFIEIRAGAGGDEAGIFAADLLRMYMRYAEGRNWKPTILEENATGVGGYKEVIFSVKGKGAYSRFKYESGVHRVQRVPQTESQGRIHTSTATVAVLPEAYPADLIDERFDARSRFLPEGDRDESLHALLPGRKIRASNRSGFCGRRSR